MLFVTALADYTGVLIVLVLALVSYFMERARIGKYTDGLVQHGRLDQERADIAHSTFQRRIARLGFLFSGDVQGWRTSRKYYQRLTEAAFAWHRAKRGDKKAISRLRKLEQEYTELGWALKTQTGAD